MRKLLVVSKLDFQLVLPTYILDLDVGVQSHSKCSRCSLKGSRKRLALSYNRLFIDRKEWGKVFCLSNRQFLIHNFLSQLNATLRARNSQNSSGMASCNQSILNELLDLFRKIK